MTITLLLTLGLLLIVAIIGSRNSNLPKNIWLLFLAQPLAMCAAPMVVLCGGILGAKMAPTPELATLPITMMILGTASGVIPASMLMQKIGRKNGTMIGFSIAIIGALIATYAAIYAVFSLLIVGTVLLGFCMAFVAQLRFAALDSLENPLLNPKAISLLMVSGLFAAMLGPEIAVSASQLIDSPYGFAGSFFSLSILFLCAIFIISRLDPMVPAKQESQEGARSLSLIVKQPLFLIALSSSAIGYMIMSYIMTASPLSMHEFRGYDLESVKWVIQSHIIAMYIPSLISAALLKYIGLNRLMLFGAILYSVVVAVAISGHSVMHYWWAMVLLGIGWNFLYMSGTLLLPESYNANERFKVQAVNDFGVFLTQALASLSAGIILFSQGWTILIYIAIPIILLMFMMSIWFYMIRKREVS
jgi:MFS family permease